MRECPVQSSPVQSSPVQSSPVQSSPVQSSPVQSSPVVCPLISIGIRCFNASDTINRAINSALSQDYPNFEICIVDDASEDNSVEIIKRFQKEDKRINLYRHSQNQGPASTLNTIIKHANGEYIAFLDDDDERGPNSLTEQFNHIVKVEKKYPNKKIICFSYPSCMKPMGETLIPYNIQSIIDRTILEYNPERTFFFYGIGSAMAPKNIFLNFLFDPTLRRTEDPDLVIRILLDGGILTTVDKQLFTIHTTFGEDKSIYVSSDSKLKLMKKYPQYLKGWRFFRAYEMYYRTKNEHLKAKVFLILSCVCFPSKVTFSRVAKLVKISIRYRLDFILIKFFAMRKWFFEVLRKFFSVKNISKS